jgi:tetracycline repressor-like protein
VLAGDRATIGERLARAQLTLLEDPGARTRLTGLIRAASSEPEAARMLREFLMREVIGPVAHALGTDEPELRGHDLLRDAQASARQPARPRMPHGAYYICY